MATLTQRISPGSVDASRCPLCGGGNRFAMEMACETGVSQAPCWCANAAFDAELLARLPEHLQGMACLCASCVAASTAPSPD